LLSIEGLGAELGCAVEIEAATIAPRSEEHNQRLLRNVIMIPLKRVDEPARIAREGRSMP
jgi:hypothetical protein